MQRRAAVLLRLCVGVPCLGFGLLGTGLRVVIGETHREETLREALISTSRALVSVTDSDLVNLDTALHARALASDLRLVVRLSDDDLAERVQKTVGNTISRSVSYLAAPAFAAAMLEHQVLRTIPVGRPVLLIATSW